MIIWCKLKEASCNLKQVELYPPWKNYAESTIQELRKVLGIVTPT